MEGNHEGSMRSPAVADEGLVEAVPVNTVASDEDTSSGIVYDLAKEKNAEVEKASSLDDRSDKEGDGKLDGAPAIENVKQQPAEDLQTISKYVVIYVDHALSITLFHFVLAIICAAFAIPFIDLSTPDAGLRLRENPIADMADGFLAASSQMKPTGFSLGLLTTSGPVQAKVPQRSMDGDILTLVWFTDPSRPGGDNIFSQDNLIKMRQFEDSLFNTTTYQTQLCKVLDDGTCVPPRSPSKALLVDLNQSFSLSDRVLQLFQQDTFFFGADYAPGMNNTATRTQFFIGLPLPGFDSPTDRRSTQNNKVVSALGKEMVPQIMNKAFNDKSNPRMTYNQKPLLSSQSTQILFHDLTLAAIAMCLILISVVFHFRSILLGLGAIIQILISFPVTLFIYRLIFGITLFGGMHVIGIFLILGIGVDDCFVFFDAFDQATREYPDRSQYFRFNVAYKSARYSMFATSLTTALCFLSLITSGIPVLKYFGIYCCILVMLNFALVMTLFAGMLLIWDTYLRPRNSLSKREQANLVGKDVERESPIKLALLNSTLAERMFVFLGEHFIAHKHRKWFIIVISSVMIVVLSVYASDLQPSTSLDSFWPPGHPFRIYEEYNADGFYGASGSRATFRFMNGLKSPFRVNYDYSDDTDMGTPVYDPMFNPSDPSVQSYLVQQCTDIRQELPVDGDLASLNNGSLCPMTEFRDWRLARGQSFPVMNASDFHFSLLEFVYQPYQTALGGIGFVAPLDPQLPPFIANFVFDQFPTTRSQRADDLNQRETAYREWDQFSSLRTANGIPPPALGKDGSIHPVEGSYDVWMETQVVLLQNSFQSIGFSIGVAFAILLVATMGDGFSSFVGVFCLTGSVACTLGVMQLAGWTLGAVEAVSVSILCGVAVDYGIHMSIAHSDTFQRFGMYNRRERVVEGLRKLGVSVLFGALTTFLASCILLLCTISILIRFGQFMIIVISFAVTFAIFLQMAILSLPVPSRPYFTDGIAFPRLGRGIFAQKWFVITNKRCSIIYVGFLFGLCVAALAMGLNFKFGAKSTASTTSSSFTPVGIFSLPPKPLLVVNTTTSLSIDALATDAWTEVLLVSTDGSTVGCADLAQPYSFFVYTSATNPASSPTILPPVIDAIHVEFEGRASTVCYSKDTCSQGGFATQVNRDRFRSLNLNTAAFPFLLSDRRPRVHVYFPYCTADAFLGNATVVYNGDFLTLRHVGANNIQQGMTWLAVMLATSSPSFTSSSLVFQGCAIGGIGALATAIVATPLLQTFAGITKVSLIVDSMTMTFSGVPLQLLASQAWNSTFSLSFANANETTSGRMLVASSTYDWFQTRLGQFPKFNATLYKTTVESDASIFPYLMRLNGDRHCVVLNPVLDRLGMDPRVDKVVRYFSSDSADEPSFDDLYYKCGAVNDPCELNADMRDKIQLCRSLTYAKWC